MSSSVPPDSALLEDARAWVAGWGQVAVHLYTNYLEPASSTQLGDFVEATFAGYLPQVLAGWQQPELLGPGLVRVQGIGVTFTWDGTGADPRLYGWYLTDSAGKLVLAGMFSNPPWFLGSDRPALGVVPEVWFGGSMLVEDPAPAIDEFWAQLTQDLGSGQYQVAEVLLGSPPTSWTSLPGGRSGPAVEVSFTAGLPLGTVVRIQPQDDGASPSWRFSQTPPGGPPGATDYTNQYITYNNTTQNFTGASSTTNIASSVTWTLAGPGGLVLNAPVTYQSSLITLETSQISVVSSTTIALGGTTTLTVSGPGGVTVNAPVTYNNTSIDQTNTTENLTTQTTNIQQTSTTNITNNQQWVVNGPGVLVLNALVEVFNLSVPGTPQTVSGTVNVLDPGDTNFLKALATSPATVQGIAAGADGKLLWLANTGSADMVLKNLAGALVPAGDQIECPGDTDLTLDPLQGCCLAYDSAAGRWRVVSTTGAGGAVTGSGTGGVVPVWETSSQLGESTAKDDGTSFTLTKQAVLSALESFELTNPTNNWDPGERSFVAVTPDGDVTLTGIAGGIDGRLLVLYNNGSATLFLSNENPGSSASNQIWTPGALDFALNPQEGALLVYGVAGGSYWRVVAVGGAALPTVPSGYVYSGPSAGPPGPASFKPLTEPFVPGPNKLIDASQFR